MTDNFAEGLVARLQQCLVEQTETQEDDTASLTPLHKRLQRLLDTIPSSEQRKGLSLLDLQSCLRGRKGGLPHIGELGAAMRRLGWQRRRAWSNEKSAFSSKWYPAELD
jgi:hypothetical protein